MEVISSQIEKIDLLMIEGSSMAIREDNSKKTENINMIEKLLKMMKAISNLVLETSLCL